MSRAASANIHVVLTLSLVPTTQQLLSFMWFYNLFPVSLLFPCSLGAFLGQKSKALKSTWRVKKVHSFSMALRAYWLPRIAYYCRLIALIASCCAYYCCCHLSLLLLLPLVLFLLMNKNKWCFWTPSERPPRTLVILYGCRHFVQLLPSTSMKAWKLMWTKTCVSTQVTGGKRTSTCLATLHDMLYSQVILTAV